MPKQNKKWGAKVDAALNFRSSRDDKLFEKAVFNPPPRVDFMPPHMRRFLAELIFGLTGRINPVQYRLSVAVSLAAGAVLPKIAGVVVADAALVYLTFVAMTKRLHDRDKSAWWMLWYWLVPALALGLRKEIVAPQLSLTVTLIGLAIALLGLADLGFLPGTNWPNGYGPDPGKHCFPDAPEEPASESVA